MAKGFDNLLHREEALTAANAEPDAFKRAFIKQTLHTAHRIMLAGDAAKGIEPAAPFDLLFLVEIARAMAEGREILQRFLDGELTNDFGEPL